MEKYSTVTRKINKQLSNSEKKFFVNVQLNWLLR